MNPEARCRADRLSLEGSQSRNRLSKAHARPVFFLFAHPGAHMRHRRPARLSPRGMVSRLIPFLALGALPTACQDAERSLAPTVEQPECSMSTAAGLKGTIAFHSNRDGDFDIYVMNADGSGVRQLTHTTVHEFDPIWSPDGKRIAFSRLDETGDFDVIVINVDGSGAINLTNNDVVHDFAGAWSPDGKRIAFASNRDGDDERLIMNADGSGVRQLTNDPASDEGDHAGWSPDGQRIVFSSTRDGGDLDIFTMNADGSGVTQLTHNDFIADDDPVWSPDGKRIAFHSTRDGGDEDILDMNADGIGVIPRTNNSVLPDGSPISDAVPVWTASVATPAPCL